MRLFVLLALGIALIGCVTKKADGDGVLRFSGTVQAIDNGCFADGVCSVTVNETKVVTLVGWSHDTWGQRDPELAVGDAVDVLCRRTAEGCTLNGSADYFVRKRPSPGTQ